MKTKSNIILLAIYSLLFLLVSFESRAAAEQCGRQAGGVICPGGLCCSEWGYCGNTPKHCGPGCQSNCPHTPPTPPPPPPSSCDKADVVGELSDIINEQLFNKLLLHRNDVHCPAKGFYTYDAFIKAAKTFPCFGTVGNKETRTREVAAFFAQTSHEISGGWEGASDRYAWGYCYKAEVGATDPHCQPSTEWPCVPGKMYYGRGPMQLSYNYNYGPAGVAIRKKLLKYPELVETDPVVSFQTAIWFWMTAQSPKPSCHDVILGKWRPTPKDEAEGRVAGYGLLTNIINGGLECNVPSPNPNVEDRIGYYKRYCGIFGISYGKNLSCYDQKPFNWPGVGGSWSIM